MDLYIFVDGQVEEERYIWSSSSMPLSKTIGKPCYVSAKNNLPYLVFYMWHCISKVKCV